MSFCPVARASLAKILLAGLLAGSLAVSLGGAPSAQLLRASPLAPAPRGGHSMTYDATRKEVLLFGGAGATRFRDLWAWDGERWTRLSNAGPSARDDALFVHDSARARTVLFGGRGGAGQPLADTWEWDGAAWARRDVPGPGGRLHAAAAFDRAAGRTRVYGGLAADGTASAETWEWDGASWTRVAERGARAGRLANRMAYDAARRRTLLSVFDPATRLADGTNPTELWEWSGDSWRVLSPAGPGISPIQDLTSLGAAGGLVLVDGGALNGAASTWVFARGAWARQGGAQPTPRNGHALALDEARARVVLFGGFRDGEDFGDTWELDGAGWRRHSAPSGPDAVVRPESRFAAAVAFDSARGALVVHGGEAAGRRLQSDTWECEFAPEGARWRRAASTGPGRRVWASAAFDAARSRVVLFGGTGATGALGDTWEWDGAAWTRVDVPGPSARFAHELAFDAELGEVVLFGGSDAGGPRRDLWAFDGAAWRQLSDDGPSPRFAHALAHDSARGELVVFGGHGPGAGGALEPLADAWAWSSGAWRRLDAPTPGAMDHLGAAFDAARARLVVLNGGPASGPRLFEWDGAAWSAASASPAEVSGGHRLVYDSARGRVLLWTAEQGSETLSRLLAWDGAAWTRADG